MNSIKGPIVPKLNDLFALMKCNKGTIFQLLMPSYKPGTWIAQVLKEHLLSLEMLQASVLAHFACATLIPSEVLTKIYYFRCGWSAFIDVLKSAAGGVIGLLQSHKSPRAQEEAAAEK